MENQFKELRILSRYVPRIVLSHYLNKPEKLRGPVLTSFTAVVGIFDISGFSSLGSKLSDDETIQIRNSVTNASPCGFNGDSGGRSGNGSGNAFGNGTGGASGSSTGKRFDSMTNLVNEEIARHDAANTTPSSASTACNSSPSAKKPEVVRRRTMANLAVRVEEESSFTMSNGPSEGSGNPIPLTHHGSKDKLGKDGSLTRLIRRDSAAKIESALVHMDSSSRRNLLLALEGNKLIESKMGNFSPGSRRGSAALASSTSPGRRASRSLASHATSAPQGIAVEMLTTTLNQTLEPVIDVILRHNGDIVKFAGDAMIVLWETEASFKEETPLGHLTYCAVKCALEALITLEKVSIGHTSKLGMHIGIGVGHVTGNHVGGVLNRWEFYLGGEANEQMSFAETDAERGQVAISPQAFAALNSVRDQLNLQMDSFAKPTGNIIVNSIASSTFKIRTHQPVKARIDMIPFIRTYVPGAISSFLQKGLALNSCVRNITAVFVRLEGVLRITNAQEQLQTIQKSLVIIQESAYRVQGTLRQFIIDDKGAVAIVAVGLPPFYHENNALRGIKLACYLLDKGIPAAIGVTTGNAFCGSVGSSSRAEYALVGDIINLAARLMSAAEPGEICCDEHTMAESKDSIRYYPSQQITVKGKSSTVKVYRVVREHMKTKLDPNALLEAGQGLPYGHDNIVESIPLFGSNASRMDRQEKCSVQRVLLVAGKSGTGKTMLLRHFAFHHARCFLGGGDPLDCATNFHAWIPIVKEMVSRTIKVPYHEAGLLPDIQKRDNEVVHRSSFSRTKSISKIPGIVGDMRYERVAVLEYLVRKRRIAEGSIPVLNDILPNEGFASSSLDIMMTGDDRIEALQNLLFEVVEATCATKPILLLFDNAQWVDTQSWILFLRVLQDIPNVHAVVASRPLAQVALNLEYFDQLQKLPYIAVYTLKDFSYQVTSRFLCQHFQIAIMDPVLLDFVFARTDGNPAEVIKLMNFMIDAKYVCIDPDSGTISILADLDDLNMQVPQHTRAKVMSCVDALDGLGQVTIKMISISPEPVEEVMLVQLLTLFFAADTKSNNDDSGSHNVDDMRLKFSSGLGTNRMDDQMRQSVVQCEKEEILRRDPETHNNISFASEEMRLVVYDTMLPSQREMLHTLYCQYFIEKTQLRPAGVVQKIAAARSIGSNRRLNQSLHSTGRNGAVAPGSAAAASKNSKGSNSGRPGRRLSRQSSIENLLRTPISVEYHIYAALAFHLSRSNNHKQALKSYQRAAEVAFECNEIDFAEDCVYSATKLLEELAKGVKLSDLQYELFRCKNEFLLGAISIQRADWDEASLHMEVIVQLCRKRSADLQSRKTSRSRSSVTMSMSALFSVAPAPLENQLSSPSKMGSCFPRLFGRKKITNQHEDHEDSEPPISQVQYLRQRAELLIKKIDSAREKHEELTREIQNIASKTLLDQHRASLRGI